LIPQSFFDVVCPAISLHTPPGIPLHMHPVFALVTAVVETILNVIGFRDFFAAIVTAEDVSHGKPDPEVFLTAAKRIGLDPRRCVVFEDALVGIEAAHRGGMKAVAVATTNPIEALKGADVAVHRLDELSVDQLIALVNA
jgi:beta-phosphoglucomutase-like phosphatase (HAD superfamily)